MPYRNITVAELKAKRERGETFRLIDVREPDEHAIARIEGAELLPLSRNQEWISTLPKDQELVIMCHHGGRSAQVAGYLVDQFGHTNVANVLGGIDDWSISADPSVPRY